MRLRAASLIREAQKSAMNPNPLEFLGLALTGKKIDFTKVIKLIDDLVATLHREQTDDDDKKEYCEITFDQLDDSKKSNDRDISNLNNDIEELSGSIETVKDEIAALISGIKELDKSVVEATDQRKSDHEDFVNLVANDNAAKELLGIAKNRLNKFYNPKLYKAPPKRELNEEERITVNMGGTLRPTAAPGGIAGTGVSALSQTSVAPPPPPEAMEAYSKKSEESNGVIAMIDLLIKDLSTEITEATAEENNAVKDYAKFTQEAASKRASDSKSVTEKTQQKADMTGDLVSSKEDLANKKKERIAIGQTTANLHGECDWLIQNFELRKTARADEVDSLNKAKAVLSGADFSLIQIVH